jgi:hypothetical protein
MNKLKIGEVGKKLILIRDLYRIGKLALKDKRILKKWVRFKRAKTAHLLKISPSIRRNLKLKDPREYLNSDAEKIKLINNTKKALKFSLNAIRNQAVVMSHSFIELVMGKVVRMILTKHINILKRIYCNKENFSFNIIDIIDNRKSVINFLIEKEVNRFLYLSLDKKLSFFKKYFDMDLLNWTNRPYGTDFKEIDKLRHDIVHLNKNVYISDSKFDSINFYLGHFSEYLLQTSKKKYEIDIIF